MTEQEGKVMKSNKSLLSKYDIPVDHLSFKYVEKCNDRKELERIVKILRSGEEGFYSQLTESAESRLKKLAPQSCLLRSEEPVLTKSTLGSKDWYQVASEMADWSREMKNREQALQKSCASAPDIPVVRQRKSNKLASTQGDANVPGPSRIKSAAPRDYSEWDKFDADKEILKMELEDERRKEQIAKNKKLQEKEKKKIKNEEENSVLNSANNLPSVDKEYLANQERNRGNDCYHTGDYEQAVKFYSNSIVLWPTPAAYNNRAVAQLKLLKYGAVITDCNQVLEAEPENVKALHRRGLAYKGKNCYEQAYEDFAKVMELEPDNQLAKGLSEEMKRKLEPAVKSVRLSIEDECYQPHGFVFPSPKPNVARKRVERRAKREEARKITESKEVFDENPKIDQMQTDEKGSGDMKATEKIVEIDDSMQSVDTTCIKLEQQNANGDSDKISAVENVTIENDKDPVYNCDIINNENSNIGIKEHKDDFRNNEINLKIITMEENKSKDEFDSNKKMSNEGVKKCQKETKQKYLAGNDNASGKPVKIKIANKYKKNIDIEQEVASEQEEVIPSEDTKITSPFEFVKVWESLKVTSDLTSHAKILHSVKPSDLASVIGNKLDGPMLSKILQCLEKNFAPELVLEYLNNIIQLPRFNIAIMFLEAQEKQVASKEVVAPREVMK
ncbi:hypothetical protein L9F63_021694, partial [Diploptera punctata]